MSYNTQSAVKLRSELEDEFESAQFLEEQLETFEKMAYASCFEPRQLADYCLDLTQQLLEDISYGDFKQVLMFGEAALTMLDNNNIGKTVCLLPSDTDLDSHDASLLVASVCYLLGKACCGLRRFDESLHYLDRADSILTGLNKYDSCGLENTIRHVSLAAATRQQLYTVNAAMGERHEAVVHARNVLMFKELIIDGNYIKLGNAYIEAYNAYVDAMDVKQALPLCLKFVPLCILVLVAIVRVDLAVMYRVAGNYGKATEEKELWQSVLKNTHTSSDFLKADLNKTTVLNYLSSYDEVADIKVKVVEDIKCLEPSVHLFMDKAVRLLNKLKENVASSLSQDSNDPSAEM